MRSIIFVVALLAATVLSPDKAWTQHHHGSTNDAVAVNTLCPVKGNPVNPEVTAEYDGKMYAFCCAGCIQQFKKDPAKYLKSEAMQAKPKSGHHDRAGCCAAHAKASDEKSDSESKAWVRSAPIDLAAIDLDGDGHVYQDQMCWHVIADEAGKCPLCGMTLERVSLSQARANLEAHDIEATDSGE